VFAPQQQIIQEDEMINGTDKPVSPATSPLPQGRSCKFPGCEAKLVYNNKSGFCQKHKPPRQANSKANGHDPAGVSKANGQDLAGIEERVNLVLAAIPVEAKLRMVRGWLSGGGN
jgi:hypothetical protein